MAIELRLSDPRVGSDLLDYFQRNGLRAVLDRGRLIVESRHQAPERQLAEVTMLVEIWQIMNPDYAVEITAPE